jgi:hypothetical protein
MLGNEAVAEKSVGPEGKVCIDYIPSYEARSINNSGFHAAFVRSKKRFLGKTTRLV